MDINHAFPSKYLKCADLMGRKARAVIDRVDMDQVGEDTRMIVSFRGKEKALVLNKTNANTIAEMHGPETDNWYGKEITLIPARVDYQGKRVDAIRVEFTQPPPRTEQRMPQQVMQDEQQQRRAATPLEGYKERVHDERNPPPQDRIDGVNDTVPF